MESQPKKHMLGVLGGMGPLSSSHFYSMLIAHVAAKSDNEHPDVLLCSRASIPDRTAHILDPSMPSPVEALVRDAKKLQAFGVHTIAIVCNTAHEFYEQIASSVSIRVLHMPCDTVRVLAAGPTETVGILATDGTIATGLYQKWIKKYGMTPVIPARNMQKHVMDMIYAGIKKGESVDAAMLNQAVRHLLDMGCERVILGCTELSVLYASLAQNPLLIDAMAVLAYRALRACGKNPIGFPDEFLHLTDSDV